MTTEGEQVLKPGEDPRMVLPRHAERGAVNHSYTLEMIAEAANVNYQTVRKAISSERLIPTDLRSVANYIQSALARKSQPIKGPEVLSTLPKKWQKWWADRYPKFDLYRCAAPGCSELLFFPGACSEHGGDRRPPVRLDSDGHIIILFGEDYIPLHRLITQPKPGLQTHHRDGNPWNNRWENLEALTPEEHESRHLGGILGAELLKDQPPRRPLHAEARGMTKAELQKIKDEAYARGLAAGKKR